MENFTTSIGSFTSHECRFDRSFCSGEGGDECVVQRLTNFDRELWDIRDWLSRVFSISRNGSTSSDDPLSGSIWYSDLSIEPIQIEG